MHNELDPVRLLCLADRFERGAFDSGPVMNAWTRSMLGFFSTALRTSSSSLL